MKSFKQFREEVAANNIGSGNIETPGYSKEDRRKKNSVTQMFRRNRGLNALKKVVK